MKALLPLPWGERKDVACFCPFAFVPWTPLSELSGTGHDGEFSITARFLWYGMTGTHPAQPTGQRGAARLRGVSPSALRRAHVPAPPAATRPSCLAPHRHSARRPGPSRRRCWAVFSHLFSKSSPYTHLGKAAGADARCARVPVTCPCVSLSLLPPARDRWAGRMPLLPLRVRSEDGDGWVTSPRPVPAVGKESVDAQRWSRRSCHCHCCDHHVSSAG